jgi:hypothetical protein
MPQARDEDFRDLSTQSPIYSFTAYNILEAHTFMYSSISLYITFCDKYTPAMIGVCCFLPHSTYKLQHTLDSPSTAERVPGNQY